MRDALRSGAVGYNHLDACQLVKHAFGLVTESRRRGLRPILYYVFAEPNRSGTRNIPPAEIFAHRLELEAFAEAVRGDEVAFHSSSYCEWVSAWSGAPMTHGAALLDRFRP
jgi:hypothetical protein